MIYREQLQNCLHKCCEFCWVGTTNPCQMLTERTAFVLQDGNMPLFQVTNMLAVVRLEPAMIQDERRMKTDVGLCQMSIFE